jgi:hypothetical protein
VDHTKYNEECSTKPHVHKKFEIFWTNIASTMAFLNFKNGPKNGLRPLGVKWMISIHHDFIFHCDLHMQQKIWSS